MSTKPVIVAVEITEDADGLHVWPTWGGVALDRTTGSGFGLKKAHRALAERLKKAMLAGVVFTSPTVATDIEGKTYVSARSQVMGRYMNADLRKLGF